MTPRPDGVIRVVTWNLWAFDVDQPARRAAIHDVLVDLAPDVCCLQEVRTDASHDTAAALGRALDLHVAAGRTLGDRWWQRRLGDPTATVGNVVLSRWPVDRVEVVALPTGGGADERSATFADIDAPGGPLLVASTQLTSAPHLSALRCAQVTTLAHAVADLRCPGAVTIVSGDLNAEPDSDEVRRLCGHKTAPAADGVVLLDAWRFAPPSDPGFTWDRRNPHVERTGEPDSRIDYILVGPRDDGRLAAVSSVAAVGAVPRGSVWPSDHAGVVADLRLPPRPPGADAPVPPTESSSDPGGGTEG